MNCLAFIRVARKYTEDCFPRDVIPPFFLMQVKELIKAKYQIPSILIDQRLEKTVLSDIVNELIFMNCGIAVISADSGHLDDCIKLCGEIKKRKASMISIVVGHAATYCTQQLCYEGGPIDYAIRGEYQVVLTEMIRSISEPTESIVRYIENGMIFASTSKELSRLHIIKNIDDLPLVPKTKQEMKQYHNIMPVPCSHRLIWGRVFATYGCPNSCAFCTQTIRRTYGNEYRKRDIARIIDEIQYLKNIGANIIEFADDNFSSSRQYVMDLCNRMITSKVNVKWGIHVRVDDVDYEMLSLIKRAGCFYVRCGVESGSSNIIKKIGKTRHADSWRQQTRQFFSYTKQLGIMTSACIILGMPGETREDVIQTKELIMSVEPDIVKIHSFCSYPGSKFYDEMKMDLSREDLSLLSHHSSYLWHKDADAWRYLENTITTAFYFRLKYILRHGARFMGFYLFNMRCTIVLMKYIFRIALLAVLPRKKECFLNKDFSGVN
ncbi:MAG: radical SAM protein [Candidatus Omnitrophica bacterium]|nr:radical SAM protein [Candidatus Omnitrophota bacterium]